MASLFQLLAAGLAEKDTRKDVMWTWSYPSVTSEQRELLLRKCCLNEENSSIVPFVFGQFRKIWFYIITLTTSESSALAKVKAFSLFLLAKDFNPEKYKVLGEILAKSYKKTGNPSLMLQNYLSVLTKGTCSSEDNGVFKSSQYEIKSAYAKGSVKDLINKFGMESIIIYTCILLKKRLVIYCPHREELQDNVRSLPSLVWHRQNWSICFPLVDLEEIELQELRGLSTFVAGFTNAAIQEEQDLFDVSVNLTSEEITISPQAKEHFVMGKLHKDIAQLMVQSAGDSSKTNQGTIQDISEKTKELINKVKSLAEPPEDGGASKISVEALRSRKMQPATENFLIALAAAEGLLQT